MVKGTCFVLPVKEDGKLEFWPLFVRSENLANIRKV